MPTNWKREESKGCPAPLPAAAPTQPGLAGLPGEPRAGSVAHRPLSLDLHPSPRGCHAGSTRERGNQGHQH